MGSEKRAQIRGFQHDRAQVDKSNAFNIAQATTAWKRAKQSIIDQNLYNTPESQMARFKEAGLNPNLIYGQGETGNQSRIAEYQGQKTDYSSVRSPDLSAEHIRLQRQDALNAMLQTSGAIMDNRIKAQQYKNLITGQHSIAAGTMLKDYQTEDLRINQNIKKNLHNYPDSGGKVNPLGEEMSKYNQQTDQQRKLQNDLLEKQNLKNYLEAELRRTDIDAAHRKATQSWLDLVIKGVGVMKK